METPLYTSAEPTRVEITVALKRVLLSRRFRSAKRNSRFLQFIVEKALEGSAREIKEIVVAAEVYGRGCDYDPKVDSVVRVEAGRLRTRLARYYEQEGSYDPVRIEIAKGTYVPRFVLATQEAQPSREPAWAWLSAALSRVMLFLAGRRRASEEGAAGPLPSRDITGLRPETSFS